VLRVAVIGGGISGLGAAWRLREAGLNPVVFEAEAQLGGHAHTVDVSLDSLSFPVDTGFLVYNERTYPHLIAMFERLQVPVAKSDMSFAVSVGPHEFEWCGSNLATVFAQPANLLRPRFLAMLRDILRFNREATALAQHLEQQSAALDEPLDAYLVRQRYSTGFREDYLLPMAAAIWSCPMSTMMQFPIGAFVRFFNNHGLLQVSNRPQWFTVAGGSREYVNKLAAVVGEVRTASPVHGVRRLEGRGVEITSRHGIERFDAVIMACHSDQSLGLLSDATAQEQEVLGAVRYQPNVTYLHTDIHLMPKRRSAWAAWNYLSATPRRGSGDSRLSEPAVSVTYWLNRLQPLPCQTPVLVSLNPLQPPAPETILRELHYSHPVFDVGAMQLQKRVPGLQGQGQTWFAGAWCGYGFHEDGLRSGLQAADSLLAQHGQMLKVAA
jgi:uncharacterized protein